jgi:hypothetical protein
MTYMRSFNFQSIWKLYSAVILAQGCLETRLRYQVGAMLRYIQLSGEGSYHYCHCYHHIVISVLQTVKRAIDRQGYNYRSYPLGEFEIRPDSFTILLFKFQGERVDLLLYVLTEAQ